MSLSQLVHAIYTTSRKNISTGSSITVNFFSSIEYDSDDNESYPIHNAVLKGDCESILSLLENGYNVNCANDRNETPVYLAVFYKKYDVLKLLLSQDAEPVTEGYPNPLLLATSNDDHECVEVKGFFKKVPILRFAQASGTLILIVFH